MALTTPNGPVTTPNAPVTTTTKDENATENTVVTERYVDPKTNKISTRRYLKGKFLGKGGFAKVFEFVNLDSTK